MTAVRIEQDGVAKPNDFEKEIAAHLIFIERLRGPLSFDLILELLEKTFFNSEMVPPKSQSRLILVYLKHNPELKREMVTPLFKQYIQKIIPYIVELDDQQSVSEHYTTELDKYQQQIADYFKRVPLVV